MNLIDELVHNTDERAKQLNADAFGALETFLIENRMYGIDPFKHLAELIHRTHPPKERRLYRGTKFRVEKIPQMIEDQEFTIAKDKERPFRSWTPNINIAKSFMRRTAPKTFGVLLREVVPSREIIVDLTDENLFTDIENTVKQLDQSLYNMYGADMQHVLDTNHNAEAILYKHLDQILKIAKEEEEVIRWVETKPYRLTQNLLMMYVRREDLLYKGNNLFDVLDSVTVNVSERPANEFYYAY